MYKFVFLPTFDSTTRLLMRSTMKSLADLTNFLYVNQYIRLISSIIAVVMINKRSYVKPHTTKVACFLCRHWYDGCPLGTSDCLSTDTVITQITYTALLSSAWRLIRVDRVQVLLLLHWGTFASMRNLSVAGTDFNISLIKYLPPML